MDNINTFGCNERFPAEPFSDPDLHRSEIRPDYLLYTSIRKLNSYKWNKVPAK